jgi:hypothetical protein
VAEQEDGTSVSMVRIGILRAELLDLIAITDSESGPTYVCINYNSAFDRFRASAFV